MIYLDHNAATPVHPEVIEAFLPLYREGFANPSSVHAAGRKAREALEKAREQVARFVGCSPVEVVFTSSGTEADNLAIKGTALALRTRGNHIITTAVEHPAVINSCLWLETQGFEVTRLPVDSFGIPDPAHLENAITHRTILISVMRANHETGTLLPVNDIAEVAARHGIHVHCDAVQAAGRVRIDRGELDVHLLSLSGHKVNGPKGAGALVVKKGVKLHPLIHGGPQERNRRGGTENVASIVGMGKACELAGEALSREAHRLRTLRDRLEQGILQNVPDVTVNGHRDCRLPNTTNLSFGGITAESLLMSLDLEGIAASSGAACSSGTLRISPVLAAMGVAADRAKGSLRFSLGRGNTLAEVEGVIQILPSLVERLRRV